MTYIENIIIVHNMCKWLCRYVLEWSALAFLSMANILLIFCEIQFSI